MNITAAVRDYLRLERGVLAVVPALRIFGAELPEEQARSMPRKTVVLTVSGGMGGVGSSTYQHWIHNRFDVRCYGETPYEADLVHNAVFRAMRELRGHRHGGVRLSDAVLSGGPLPGRDMDADWPYTIGVYTLSGTYA